MTATGVSKYDDYIDKPNTRDLDHLPGDYGLPILGHTIQFLQDPCGWAQDQYQKYGYLSKMHVTGDRAVVALGPDLVQQVMLDPNRDFSSKMGYADRVSKFFSGSLIMEDFEHHRHQRRIMQTAFKNESLKYYTAEINGIYDRALNEWETKSGSTISFFAYIKELLLEVAAEVFIGEKERGERMRRLNKAFTDCVSGMMYAFPVNLPGFKLHKGLQGKAYLERYFSDLVPARRFSDDLDMLSHFCREKDEDGNFFSNAEITNQTIFLLFAAHDTTTAAITHTIYFLTRHPDVKQKLYQECVAIGKPELGYEDLEKVPYMQQVFNEVLRMRPSVPMLPRRTIRDVEMAGYRVPAHTMVYTMPRFNHFLEDYWTEPKKFDPDRFSPERAEHKQHRFLYHPFGGGAHKCIGMHFSQMEFKCFLHKFLLKYDFVARHKKEPAMRTFPLPKPADDMPIQLIRR